MGGRAGARRGQGALGLPYLVLPHQQGEQGPKGEKGDHGVPGEPVSAPCPHAPGPPHPRDRRSEAPQPQVCTAQPALRSPAEPNVVPSSSLRAQGRPPICGSQLTPTAHGHTGPSCTEWGWPVHGGCVIAGAAGPSWRTRASGTHWAAGKKALLHPLAPDTEVPTSPSVLCPSVPPWPPGPAGLPLQEHPPEGAGTVFLGPLAQHPRWSGLPRAPQNSPPPQGGPCLPLPPGPWVSLLVTGVSGQEGWAPPHCLPSDSSPPSGRRAQAQVAPGS